MQMVWELYDSNNKLANTITASDEDYVKTFCQENGYTYRAIREDKSFILPEVLNRETLTEEKINAISERQDFIEDCIAEMATQVYKED